MTTITNQRVDEVVKEAGARFIGQPQCVANKPNMLELVQTLEAYTDEVQVAADTYGLTDSQYMQQWANDMNNWRLRLAGYYAALSNARHESGPESCEELRSPVNEPLLVGWYEPGTPGIVNPDLQTVADVATPYMLGNQVIVYRQHQKERLDKLIEELFLLTPEARAGVLDYWCEKTGTCGPGGWGSDCDTACWLRRIAIGMGVIVGGYVAYRGVKWGIGARARAMGAPIGPDPGPSLPREDNPALVEICEMPGMFVFVEDGHD